MKIAYTVEEAPGADSPYVLSGTAGGAAQGFRLTNRLPVGGLTVEKAVTGLDGSGRAFTFTVVLTGTAAPVNGVYGDMTFVDNVATFSLKAAKKRAQAALPAGVGYTVAEAEANADGYTTSAVGASGTIADNAMATASFVNARLGGLTVEKTVSGTAGEKERAVHVHRRAHGHGRAGQRRVRGHDVCGHRGHVYAPARRKKASASGCPRARAMPSRRRRRTRTAIRPPPPALPARFRTMPWPRPSFENAREQEDPLPIPPTGDGTHLGLFLAAAGRDGASTAVLGALLLRRRRRARR